MSQARQVLTIEQEPFLAVRSLACGYSSGTVVPVHKHDWHQLLYARAGSMSVYASRQAWMIPPGKAVFLPAGWEHSIRMWGSVALRSLAFPTKLWKRQPNEECRVLSVSPLLRELILKIVAVQALDSRMPSHQHLLGVLLDEMNAAAVAPLALPLPWNERALEVARHVLAHSAANDSLDWLAHRYGSSRRTLERCFHKETGMSFGLWRQKARMLDALRFLPENASVTNAALDCGYASVSAFIAAFKKTFGCTPAKYRAAPAKAEVHCAT